MTFCLNQPGPATIRDFLARQKDSRLSYPQAGITKDPPAGFNVDRQRTLIGHGFADFAAARARLFAWQMFPPAWTRVSTDDPNVAVSINHLGFWSLNACRVVYEVNQERRAGFAYGTLLDHAECGEELFAVEMDAATGDVIYELVAVSRPAHFFAKLGYPYVRRLQARFRRDSAAAMQLHSSHPLR